MLVAVELASWGGCQTSSAVRLCAWASSVSFLCAGHLLQKLTQDALLFSLSCFPVILVLRNILGSFVDTPSFFHPLTTKI